MRPARPRVLIVDDQAANIDVLAEALGDAYELFAATTADRALELAHTGVDLILLDIVMPDRNGFDLCRDLKASEKTRSIPIIFVTALGEVHDEERGFDEGGVDYIAKPISPPTVRARVRTHLELRGAQKRLEKEAEVLAENLRLKEHVERLSRHDLKTPLNSVVSLPQILLESPGLTKDQIGMLHAIETAGYRILDMVNRSLDLYRMESGAYEFQPARVDVEDVAQRVTVDLAPLARERGVRFVLPARGARRSIALAEDLLTYSMLANLLKNAVEASPRDGEVRVDIAAGRDEVVIAVHNQGAVPAALRDAFFRKYASVGKRSGTGLGAYSARLMAETQRGRISMATSDADGTTITVVLKSADEASVASPVPAAETREIRRHVLPRARVLIVDDDETTRFVLARFLEDAAVVALAGDGVEALAKAADVDPQVTFLDAEMPGLDGFAAAERLRAQEIAMKRSRALIVGLSSHDDAATRTRFIEAGCDLVLVKPIARPAILAVVEAALADRMSASANPSPAPEVEVDRDLLALIPAFLESRREQSRDLVATLAAGERDHARAVAHKLRGGLEMCGFTDAAARSREIEERLARGEAIEPLSAKADDLRLYLERVRYRPRAAETREPSQEE